MSENMPCRGGKEGEEGGKAVLGDDTMVYGNMGIRAYGQTGMWHTGSNFLWLVAGWEGRIFTHIGEKGGERRRGNNSAGHWGVGTGGRSARLPPSGFHPGREVTALKAASGRVRELGRKRVDGCLYFGVRRSFRRAGASWGWTGGGEADRSKAGGASHGPLGGSEHAAPGTAAFDRSSSDRWDGLSFWIRNPSAHSSDMVATAPRVGVTRLLRVATAAATAEAELKEWKGRWG